METWQSILRDSITTYDQLKKHLGCDNPAIGDVIKKYPLRINPYYLSLIKHPHDPLYRQAVPDPAELHDHICLEDPLDEEYLCKAPHLVHKYPDRVLLLVNGQCPMYCRFCTRKRKVGTEQMVISPAALNHAYEYLREHHEVREVLISGGDPLLLADEILDEILEQLSSIKTVEVIRIGSRVPCTLPMRITDKLVSLLKRYHPLYINTHFNHPAELTEQAKAACGMLADGGIPLGCQTVLLKGVNDNSKTLARLFTGLLRIRVKPYYLFQADLTQGTDHLRTHSSCGIRIMRDLIGTISGMAIPTFAIDAPYGRGKVPLTPNYILEQGDNLTFSSYTGEVCTYPEAGEPI